MTAFLGVEASATGRRWIGPTIEADRLAEAMVQETCLPSAVARVLVARGVAPDDAARFLDPHLRDLLPDPRSLRDMSLAAQRFIRALNDRERIAIFADYDVDGGSSAALLIIWLRAMGHKATLYIPDRIDEGYGPNVAAMTDLAAAHDLIICVVNPNRQDETGDLAHLCAASVVFLMLVEANRLLRDDAVKGPDLMAMLDLVALATVADVAPLIGVNRALVRQGLKVLARRERVGLRALADVARMDQSPTAYHLGFLLGPRVNAGGRIGAADLGARLLATDNVAEALALAQRLDALNTERRDIEARVREEAMAQAEARGLEGPLVWAASDGWHPGVVGIVAARLKEATNRPAVVIGFDGDAGKGSGRSVAGVDLGAAIQRLATEGLLQKGGGHKMAAGLSLSRAQLEPAMARLSDLLARQGAGSGGPRDLRLDGLLMPTAATQALIEDLEKAGPFGQSASAPRFAFPSVAITHTRHIGESHLRLNFTDGVSAPIEAICFGAFDTALGPMLENHGGMRFHLAGRLEVNFWNGRSKVQLRLEDAARAEMPGEHK
jgi:single-stranded-DNA-specific exonuclease